LIIYTCVAIELEISIIVFVIILTFASHLQDPFHLFLINDEEENRIWCITEYSFRFFAFNTTMAIERKRLYKALIYQQIRKHKHILITPFTLILLALPRLICLCSLI